MQGQGYIKCLQTISLWLGYYPTNTLLYNFSSLIRPNIRNIMHIWVASSGLVDTGNGHVSTAGTHGVCSTFDMNGKYKQMHQNAYMPAQDVTDYIVHPDRSSPTSKHQSTDPICLGSSVSLCCSSSSYCLLFMWPLLESS
jgi:hypothetical protein